MIGAPHSQQGSRAWFIVLLRWSAAFAVLGILLHFLPLAPLRAAIERVPAPRLLLVLLGYLLAHTIGVAKWRMVVNAAGAELDFATSVQCYAGGLFGTLFLPSIVGGDVIRLAVGLRHSPRPAAVVTGNVVDRFLDVAAQAGLLAAALLLLPESELVPEELEDPAQKLVLLVAAGVILLFVPTFLLRRQLLGGRSVRFRRLLARLRHALRAVSKRPRLLLFGWLLGTFIQMALLLLTARLAVYCGLVLPLRVWLFAWPLAKLAALLPLTQGGIGVREAALVALLAPFGAPGHLVLAAGLIWEGIIITGGLIAGAVAFLLSRRDRRGVPRQRG
jgi:glycosyltransferase 2 family protein